MRRVDIIKRASANLRQSKTRTFLTSLAIAVGAFTLTASLAVGEGARQYAERIIRSNIDPQTIFVAKDKTIFEGGAGSASGVREYSVDSTQFAGMTFKSLNSQDIDLIKNTANVESVTPSYIINIQYFSTSWNDKKFASDVTVYNPNVLATLASGSLPAVGQQIGDDEIVVPESFLEVIAPGKSPADIIGKELTLHVVRVDQAGASAPVNRSVALKVRAVSAKSTTSFSASSALFVSETKARELSEFLTKGTSQQGKFISATVQVKQGVDPQSVADTLTKKGIVAKTARDLQNSIFVIIGVMQAMVAGFGVLALIASVFGIINTQYISVLERTSQIGLMKALGMPSRSISKLIRYEAAWIGFLGGVIGAGLAIIIGVIANPIISQKLSLGDDVSLLIFVWWQIALLIVGLVIVAIVSGWLPARKASKLDPIEALRTE